MNRGYTKRWRKRWDTGYQTDPLLWVMMDYFIDYANYKDSEVYCPGYGMVKLKRGDHIYSLRRMGELLNVDIGKIRRRLKILQGIKFLTLQTTHHFSLASVINYDTYQTQETNHDTQNDIQPTPDRHLTDTSTALPNKVKKVKKVNNTNNACAWPKDFILTEQKIQYAVENGIDPKKVTAFFSDFKDWALSKGATYKDWDAAFRTRVRKAEEYGRQFIKVKTYEQEKSDDKFEEYKRIISL